MEREINSYLNHFVEKFDGDNDEDDGNRKKLMSQNVLLFTHSVLKRKKLFESFKAERIYLIKLIETRIIKRNKM